VWNVLRANALLLKTFSLGSAEVWLSLHEKRRLSHQCPSLNTRICRIAQQHVPVVQALKVLDIERHRVLAPTPPRLNVNS
jgi:hypothetical protein